ncbi:HK97-gp10 family putative phage morphogenesis protein [Enterobacter huaxiensis]|uniref:HK97-gp10 family putative phage morphogenesis protein n=1 Tax=Enterobacter huaxiensis TaxID=2494702 RepID=UPI002175A651|nr:HK97-gp10 family putative phage morphogenesis protein [Enterobacter huaxiensis]MCS5452499.1 HK97 gp10 family phage protein [Enterobacter huaxiensis]
MISTKLDFSALKTFAEDLNALSKTQNRRVLNAATRAGASIITKEAKQRAPVKTGKLRKNIVTLSAKGQGAYSSVSGVHIRGRNPRTGNSDNTMKADNPNNAFYWRFIEMGTSKKAAAPFIRPAFESKLPEAEEAVIVRAMAEIDKVFSK